MTYIAIRHHTMVAPIFSERSYDRVAGYVQVGPDHWQALTAYDAYEFIPTHLLKNYVDERYFARAREQSQSLSTIPIHTLQEVRGQLISLLETRVNQIVDDYDYGDWL